MNEGNPVTETEVRLTNLTQTGNKTEAIYTLGKMHWLYKYDSHNLWLWLNGLMLPFNQKAKKQMFAFAFALVYYKSTIDFFTLHLTTCFIRFSLQENTALMVP